MSSERIPSAPIPSAPIPIVSLGAGRMGRGIALAFAYAGMPVALVDFKSRSDAAWLRLRDEAMEEIRSSLSMLAELGMLGDSDETRRKKTMERILEKVELIRLEESSTSLRQAELVFEAVPETLEAKRDALERLCLHCSSSATIASTTSTILVTDLVPMVSHPERLLNAHWLNPAYVVPLVEISTHPGTDLQVLAKLKALLEAIGKEIGRAHV